MQFSKQFFCIFVLIVSKKVHWSRTVCEFLAEWKVVGQSGSGSQKGQVDIIEHIYMKSTVTQFHKFFEELRIRRNHS
jgi:hypothetical protein